MTVRLMTPYRPAVKGVDLFDKIDRTGECWIWEGGLFGRYGNQYAGDGRFEPAHRHVYKLLVGEIPEGHSLHHTCFEPLCVNPSHLEPMTRSDHMRLHMELRREQAA